MGSFTYGDSARLHTATTVGSGSSAYTASYDASGNMVCRAPIAASPVIGRIRANNLPEIARDGSPLGKNAPTAPTSTDSYLYDGEGHRVEQ